MKTFLTLLLTLVASAHALLAADTRILIVVGPSNHPPGSHEVAAGGRLLRHCLEHMDNLPGVKADVVEGWPDRALREAASSIVFIGDFFPPNRLPNAAQNLADLDAMMQRGCGIVCVHYATGLHGDDVTPDGDHPLLRWIGGYFANRSCPHHESIARIFPAATITPAALTHPVSRGWKEFTLHDEPYINNYFGPGNVLSPNVTVLATSLLPPESPKRETVAWSIDRADTGRGFGIVMPHFYKNWQHDDLRRFILNGIVWSAKLEVPAEGVKTTLPDLATFQPASVASPPAPPKATERFQYRSGDISIPAASAGEPRIESFGADSLRAAARYLDDGALAWTRERSCMACHTTGVYLAERPSLTPFFGPPLEEVRDSFVAEVPADSSAAEPRPEPHGFLVWRALGLAQWDQHVSGTVSEPTDRALRHLLRRLPADGLYDTVSKVEIPYTTTGFELTVQAARALAAAPGWLARRRDGEMEERVGRLKAALGAHLPRNDYERALQLQLATAMPELVPQATRDAAIAMLRVKQHPDGGWSTRDLSVIENWGDQIRPDNLAMLRAEPDADHPASDTYLTAFANILLRENGVPAANGGIQRGLAWLRANQRASGHWWMKSLYKPTSHFSTYIATAHALRAFALCGELPATIRTPG